MKIKYNIDITITNDCGTEYHVCDSSSGCDFFDFSCKNFDFKLKCLELQNEELSVILSSHYAKKS